MAITCLRIVVFFFLLNSATLLQSWETRSVIPYFLERCIGGYKANNLWPTVKLFLLTKSTGGQQKIALMENDVILNDKKDVSDTFNSFLENIANDIGKKGFIFDENNHPSIARIRKKRSKQQLWFWFQTNKHRHYSKINIKKATGVDQIACKLLTTGAPVLNKHLTTPLNITA